MRATISSPVFAVLLLLIALFSLFSSAPGQTHRRSDPETMTDAELTNEAEIEKLRSINKALRKPAPSEKRAIGYLQKIDCKNGVEFTLVTDTETFRLESKDFGSLSLNAFVPMSGEPAVGCDSDVSSVKALITYTERSAQNGRSRGDITAIEFVPKDFRILSQDEIDRSRAITPTGVSFKGNDANDIARSIRQSLTQPKEGEKWGYGYLESIECTGDGRFFHLRTAIRTLTLFNGSPDDMQIRLFTTELEGLQFGCAMKPIIVPAVFIYRENTNPKLRADGEIISLEFVPRSFPID
ncbi:MAG: hypothetical protein ACREO5_12325 [Candidatus Binatia bacterium]